MPASPTSTTRTRSRPSWPPPHTVVRYDMRGFGASPAPTSAFSHLDDLTAVLDELGADPHRAGRQLLRRLRRADLRRHPSRAGDPPRPARLRDRRLEAGGRPMTAYDEAETAALDAGDLDEAVRGQPGDVGTGTRCAHWSPELRALATRSRRPCAPRSRASRPPASWSSRSTARPSTTGSTGSPRPPSSRPGRRRRGLRRDRPPAGRRIAGARYAAFPGVGHLCRRTARPRSPH